MNYKIITDQLALDNFINWLPDLNHDETFYLCLFARNKYVRGDPNLTHIKSDKAQMKRFTSDKKRMVDKIRQLECPVGSYKQKDYPVPQEALALYITINPRSFTKANTAAVRKLLDLALQPYNGFHPHQEVMSEIQKSKSRSVFVSFDFDIENREFMNKTLPEIYQAVNKEAINIVATRGGFYLIIRTGEIDKSFEKTWYNDTRKILSKFSSDNDNAGDIMLPVPGTYQGGFTPGFITQ